MREWRQKTWAVVLGVILAGGAAVAAQTTGHAGACNPSPSAGSSTSTSAGG